MRTSWGPGWGSGNSGTCGQGEVGDQKWAKICGRPLWMAPYIIKSGIISFKNIFETGYHQIFPLQSGVFLFCFVQTLNFIVITILLKNKWEGVYP